MFMFSLAKYNLVIFIRSGNFGGQNVTTLSSFGSEFQKWVFQWRIYTCNITELQSLTSRLMRCPSKEYTRVCLAINISEIVLTHKIVGFCSRISKRHWRGLCSKLNTISLCRMWAQLLCVFIITKEFSRSILLCTQIY